ncbi:hypothetical protein [Streptomyces sp. NPDC093591]
MRGRTRPGNSNLKRLPENTAMSVSHSKDGGLTMHFELITATA